MNPVYVTAVATTVSAIALVLIYIRMLRGGSGSGTVEHELRALKAVVADIRTAVQSIERRPRP